MRENGIEHTCGSAVIVTVAPLDVKAMISACQRDAIGGTRFLNGCWRTLRAICRGDDRTAADGMAGMLIRGGDPITVVAFELELELELALELAVEDVVDVPLPAPVDAAGALVDC